MVQFPVNVLGDPAVNRWRGAKLLGHEAGTAPARAFGLQALRLERAVRGAGKLTDDGHSASFTLDCESLQISLVCGWPGFLPGLFFVRVPVNRLSEGALEVGHLRRRGVRRRQK